MSEDGKRFVIIFFMLSKKGCFNHDHLIPTKLDAEFNTI